MKKYIVLGGVNGAGKSTLYQILDNLKKMPRVNTDEIVKELGDWRNTSDVLKAGKIAVQLIDKYFSEGISFNQESTLCGKSIIKNFKCAKQLGYTIELHYVGVDSVETAKRRVAGKFIRCIIQFLHSSFYFGPRIQRNISTVIKHS